MKKNKNIVVCANLDNPPADSHYHWRDPFENVLIGLGYDEKQPPLAELLKYYYQLKGEWFVISPVYFHTTHNDAVIAQCGPQLAIGSEEGQWYFDKVSDFLLDEGIILHYHSPTLWLGQINEPLLLNSYSPAFLHNKSIMPYLEMLGDNMSWQKRITELQMYLQSLHTINQSTVIINGLWFWGQGALATQEDIIVTDDSKMLPLKKLWPNLLVQSQMDMSQLKRANHIYLTELINYEIARIQKLCEASPNHWYWNNVTYSRSAKRWWQLFKRK